MALEPGREVPLDELGEHVARGREELLRRIAGQAPSFAAELDTTQLLQTVAQWTDALSQQERRRTEEEKRRAEEEKRRAEEEKRRAEEEKRRAEEEKRRAEAAEKRASEYAEQLSVLAAARGALPKPFPYPPSSISYGSGKGKKSWDVVLQEEKMCTYRLPEDKDLPIDIYHDVFMAFRDNVETATVTEADKQLFLLLSANMRIIHAKEKSREEAFKSALTNAEGFLPSDMEVGDLALGGRRGRADLVVRARASPERVVSIIEVKQENCLSGYLQVCAYYQMYVHGKASPADKSEVFFASNWPLLLLTLDGPYIMAVGAVWVHDHALFEPLAAQRVFFTCPGNYEASMDLMRFLAAVRIALAQLTAKREEPEDVVPLRWLDPFPYRDHFGAFRVRYTAALKALSPVFRARVISSKDEAVAVGQEVVVKFVQGSYGIEAHRAMAERGMAPSVYAHEAHGARWYVVVMAFIGGRTLHETGVGEAQAEQLTSLIGALHEDGFVFGDFRLQNIIQSAAGRLMLIDFNWADEAGRARYPYLLNNVDITWPDGVCEGGLIEKEHDLAWLARHSAGEREPDLLAALLARSHVE